MILGCDAAGIDRDGNEVVVHAVISDAGLARRRDAGPATVAAVRTTPGHARRAGHRAAANLVAKPAGLSLRGGGLPADGLADRLSDAVQPGPRSGPGDSVLVQGAGGGVATALISLARAAGCACAPPAATRAKRARAVEIGAHAALDAGSALPIAWTR